MKLVSIITVNYNHPHETEALIESIFATNDYPEIEIIVVDNGSDQNPVPAWQKQLPPVTFIRAESNLGFAGGNNLGIKSAKGDFLFLVNNDTVFTKELIPNLISTFEEYEDTGMVSPKIRYFDDPNVLQYAGFTPLNYFTARNSCIGQYETDKGQYDGLQTETGYVHGAAMMVKKEAIEKAGLMAENFFLYYEELDWCERIRKAGYQIRVNTNALIYHKESISVGKNSSLKEYFMNRNRILIVRKHGSFIQQLAFYIYFLMVVTPLKIISYIRNRRPEFIGILLKAIRWNFTNSTESDYLGYKLK
jgi:GT2 family glycosyltransferase